MSPSSPRTAASPKAATALGRLLVLSGARIREERTSRRWSIRELAGRARLSPAAVQAIESGRTGSLDAYTRLASALGLVVEIDVADPRRRERPLRQIDLVHSAMGEFEARHLRHMRHPVGIDEPYQHYQFAGRADLVGWSVERAALLHIENRTRFPDLQDAAGAYNAKRAYLPAALAERLGIKRWQSITHVMACLWSAEVLHVLRLRSETFRALCPDPIDDFASWWAGTTPLTPRTTSTLIVLDPLAHGRQRPYLNLEEALSARSRHRGYSEVAARLAVADEH